MKKGQVYEGIIESVEFPNKGRIYLPEEDRWVVVKNGVPGQKVRFSVNKIRKSYLLSIRSEKEKQKGVFWKYWNHQPARFRQPVHISDSAEAVLIRIFRMKSSLP